MIGLGLSAASVPEWMLRLPGLGEQEAIVPFSDVPDNFPPTREIDGRRVPTRMDFRELRDRITPNDEYFTVAHYGVPQLDPVPFRLEIGGLVGRPTEYSLDDLRSRPRVERTVTFECGGNQARAMHGLVGNASWAGASLREVLLEAGPTSDATEVAFWAADTGTEEIRGNEYEQNFARSLSLDEALSANAILAYEMNGEALPASHGAPLRLVAPGYYGICNVKWLNRIELGSRRLMTRFMARDYVTIMGREVDGRIEWVETSVKRQNLKSVVARVTRVGSGGSSRFTVFGAAWSDGTPIERVEVQVDEGPWRRATLEEQENPFSWTFFNLEMVALPPGEHTVASRATDDRGRVQPLSLDLKRTYWEDNAVWRRTIQVSG